MEDFIEVLHSDGIKIQFVKGLGGAKYPYSNSLLINNWLIDTGISSKHLRKLKRKYEINHVILTHWHEDHISGNRFFKDVNFYCHLKDKSLIENVDMFYKYYGIEDTPAAKLFQSIMEGFRIENTPITKSFRDKDKFPIEENYNIQIIHTPGHTAGHSCIYDSQQKLCFLADIDLSSFPFYGSLDANLMDFENSIEKLKKVEIDIAISSHKSILRGKNLIKEELKNYTSVIWKRDDRILENLSEKTPKTIDDLSYKNLIYKRYNKIEKIYEIIAEKLMIKEHLKKLVKNGRIILTKEGYLLNE
ncbi:MAG: MBL fold metallo-hydrolase [Candidatus Lokiarchaeota archaeon]|nr:MBL fold metallo-hydrolase [Candidatus Lokiarchaeota archaeon]MBD3341012.1 MBL fold metallo-hydrolase [Candidatus Lokiarchaeota archaeon]